MNVVEASNRIGISASKLYQLVGARRIGFYRIDGKIVFSQADVDAFLSACRVETVPAAPVSPRRAPKLKHLQLRS